MPWYNPTDSKQRNWMLAGIAFFVAIVPFRMYVLQPRTDANLIVEEHVESLEGTNRRAAVTAARGGGDLEARNAELERHVAALEELIPAAEDVAGLFNDISAAAYRFDVSTVELTPEGTEGGGGFYDRTSYTMAVVGEFHSVAGFLAEIASMSRIATPVELDIAIFEQPELHPDMESPVIARFRVVTYVLPDPNAAPPPAEVPGG